MKLLTDGAIVRKGPQSAAGPAKESVISTVPYIRPARSVSRIELFDGGVRVFLSDGRGIQVRFNDGHITLIEEEAFHAENRFRDVELSDRFPEVA